MKNHFIALQLLVTAAATAMAADAPRDTVSIYFRQSKTALDTAYMTNGRALARAGEIIGLYEGPDSTMRLTGVTVTGAASPEGSVRFNEYLSRRRAERIFDYFNSRMSLPDSISTFEFIGRDWHGLRALVEADPGVPYRDDVIATLDGIIAACRDGETESQHNLERLKCLHGGEPYLYMYRRLFPELRASKLTLIFEAPRPRLSLLPIPAVDITGFYGVDLSPVFLPRPEAKKPFYMAIKTNMLYDALAVPNISAEFYLGKSLSVVGNWMYGWWDNDNRHRYWRIYGGDVAMRWWFGSAAARKPLTGHHIGIYGGVFTYDFEFGGRGYMGGLPGRTLWDRCNYQAGVEYGYSLPITRRLNIDFTIGLGYIGGQYREYVPVDRCYVWQSTDRCHWFGPTKLEVSLTWLIGRGNFNAGKGGRL